MRKLSPALIGMALAALITSSALAASPSARSLDDLLSRVKAQGQDEFAESRGAFAAASPEQRQAMLARAQDRLEALKAEAAQLSRQFSENELKLADLTQQLKAKARKLKLSGLFGLARQTAADVASALQGSLIATQLAPPQGKTERMRFLYALAGGSSVATTAELKRLWYELQRAMTAQGQVVRYPAPVVQPEGTSAIQSVLRIGPFIATSEGRFLHYLPDLNTLGVLPRPLPGEFRASLSGFLAATEGYAPAVVDPSKGVLIALMINRPTWLGRIELGGLVGYVIIAIGLIGAILFFIQLIRLISARLGVGQQLKDLDNPKANNPLGRVLLAYDGEADRIEEETELAELRITEAVLREEPRLTRFQAFLRLAVAAGPLLGLIGTVVGMIITFQTITETGSADPRLMASGIGQAMIATVLGLGIAIPLLFANALLASLSQTVVQILDKQSAGLLAERIERQRDAA